MEDKVSLKGCFPPVPTPFNEKGEVDHDRLAENLEKWSDTPLAGIVVLGSNGEAVFLREEEKLAVWETAGRVLGGKKRFIAGTGCESTLETLRLTEKAARFGADAAMIVTPHYYKARMDPRAQVRHYSFVADRSPIPLILYNVPAFTGIDLNAETIIELAAHPNIIGVKESSGNVVKIGQIVKKADVRFQVLAGSGGFLLPALSVGAVGGVMALASVTPRLLCDIVQAFDRGDLETARKIQLRLIPANAAVTVKFGIAGLKAALDLVGFYGGPVRAPLFSLDEAQRGELEEILLEAGVLP